MIKELRKFRGHLSNTTVGNFVHWVETDAMDFDAWYQRPYVWGEKEQQDFLTTLVSGFPVGVISTATNQDKETKWVEIVDGKQRLTTLRMFLQNEIPFGNIYYKDFDIVDGRFFRNIGLPYYDLSYGTEEEKLEFFYRVNFTGVSQSEEHKQFVLNKMRK